jgi:ABC-type glycerol-3-phosphate transport system substrate-binding protein
VDAWAVPLKAGRAQAAQRFAAWLTGPQGGQVWARHGGTPAHTAVLSGDGAPEEWLALARVEQLVLPLPPISTSDALWRAYHAAVHSAAAGDQPPAAALKSAAQDMRRALRMGGY